MKKLFQQILKEKGEYSQGRVYLLWSIIAYYITITILLISGIKKEELKMENFKIILDALEYAMTLFGGYVFGGKFLDVVKHIGVNRGKNTDNNEKQILND